MQKILLPLCLLFATEAHSQFADSLKVSLGVTTTAATKSYQPLWIISNRYNAISEQQADVSTHLSIQNNHIIFPSSIITEAPQKSFFIGYGAVLYNNNHLKSTFWQEGYVKAGYHTWQLRAGRYRETTGEIDPALSSGSLGISSNALPIPKIEAAVTEYTAVPFTKGWVQFKGNFAHGWLGNQGYIRGAFLHQKSLYLKVGKEQASFYGGLTHFAQWGGTFPSGKAPSRFQDYLRIVVGASGDAADPVYQQGPIDIANAVGNHLIIPDFGLTLQRSNSTFRFYTQTIFDKGIGDSANTNRRDKLNGLKILSRDRLVGMSWETSKNTWLQKVLLEGIYTKYQGGPIIYNGQDNYYNNGTYQIGWQYQNRIIGTPLFINQAGARNYDFGSNPPFGGLGIVSNRIIGAHLGFKGTIATRLTYRTLATYVQHYGTYGNTSVFTPTKKQLHILCEVPYQLHNLLITGAVGGDAGDLSNNVGGLLSVVWFMH